MKINAEYRCYKITGAKPLDKNESMTLSFLESGKLLYTHKFDEGEHVRAYFYDISDGKVNVYENLISKPCNVFLYDGKTVISVLGGVEIHFKKTGE